MAAPRQIYRPAFHLAAPPRASERETFDDLFDAGFNRGGKQAVDDATSGLAFYVFGHGFRGWAGEQGRPGHVSSDASRHCVRQFPAQFSTSSMLRNLVPSRQGGCAVQSKRSRRHVVEDILFSYLPELFDLAFQCKQCARIPLLLASSSITRKSTMFPIIISPPSFESSLMNVKEICMLRLMWCHRMKAPQALT